MKTSQRGLELIKRYEGCRQWSYRDSGGVWTVGYGHTRRVAEYEHMVTMAVVHQLLEEDVENAEHDVDQCIEPFKPSQPQYDALVSFVFNVGGPAFQGSTMRRLIRAGKPRDAAAEFIKWVKDGDKVVPGLIERRQAERDLFLEGTA
jgi:lysozyme